MNASELSGGFPDPAVDSARAFRAVMTVLARPGNILSLSGAIGPAPLSEAAATLLLTLCDADTPLFLAPSHDHADLRAWLRFHTGAPVVSDPAACLFALGTWEALQPVSRFAVGTAEYPDRSATLIVEMPELSAQGTRLTGPGIQSHAELSLPDPAIFRANAMLFPLGLDFFFTTANQVAALPRSTRLDAKKEPV